MNKPLVVDLDGTLLRSDMLIESVLAYSKKGIRPVFHLPFWLLEGKAILKARLADRVDLSVEVLPYNTEVIDFIKQAKREQRQIVLATGTHKMFAEKIAEHLGLFDLVIATENGINLSARSKRDCLIDQFGEKGFDYIGNSHDDVVVWNAADKTYLADPEPGVKKKMDLQGGVARVFQTRQSSLRTFFRALRPHQWLKNLLLFIPLIASHQLTNITLIADALLAFVLFSMTASSGYLINDLLDLESDRYHPRKRNRPLASGELPILIGLISAPLLFLASLSASLILLSATFTISLVTYYLLSVVYSQYLKKIPLVDTIMLAGLYTVRILAGAFACSIIPTFWILAFSVFFFLSLAMLKRYAELLDLQTKGDTAKTSGRGYYPSDIQIIASLGTASGYLSILVLALYIQDARTIAMYKTHELIWLACPILLFWISRMWMLTHRGQMHDDPVLFAIKDRTSLITATLFACIFFLAILV
ncbi:MAG TPA: UbiA family prenyltransferase [Chlorobaculum sp.]|uniref:NoeC protein n=1 Tax=Chlorobaculum tepidum (strain ATCC 49652 / DSM 12025 / NBRC 103806 / TLS) TaxID=194439 RepID=Q8KFZ8_CHLTE|nr:UbiA family prenyltransferase [Chlorobaculum tepidum]AAM71420.1 noeC protein [Chlorobaculum tepidum TLS]HBU23647.1 UbiA family prenyltransferase [Chlorobaculum sp.]